jgi:hypothetical protein
MSDTPRTALDALKSQGELVKKFYDDKIARLERELAALRADAERLDWVSLQDFDCLGASLIVDAPNDGKVSLMYTDDKHNERCVYGKDLRAAIDAAMKECGK